ncbi:MAG TPA: methyltransferase regulatory domain-containing protein [Casimicrobiaceae bacterium]|nr:methyltransferase regulatory domain-containing protein [Casimicrobiaceae bacterium]
MADQAETSYDEVPYISLAFPQTHPFHLATLAKMLGVAAPDVETCRVLELGCASGDNLIPMAQGLPNARFVGLDLSQRQVERGAQAVRTLELDNIELRQADILSVDESYGKFDYIICHGIYSWVPKVVRDKILSISNVNLTPTGVAYISYNTLPGWHLRGMVRDMMTYHSNRFEGAATKIFQARALIDFLAQSAPTDTPYGMALRHELEMIRNQPDSYLYHEHLEVVNEAFYFHQFAQAAQEHGLQFLAEADFSAMLVSNFSPQVADTLRKVASDIVHMEQYMDFVRNRTFRQTLLVHADLPINRALNGSVVEGLHVSSIAQPVSKAMSLAQGVPEQFRAPNGRSLNTSNAITKAAFVALAERWPLGYMFEDLVRAARARADADAGKPAADAIRAKDAEILGIDLLTCYTAGIIELRAKAPRMTTTPSHRPRASPYARLRAGQPGNLVNLRHEPVNPDVFTRHLLMLLDGTRDRDAIVAGLADVVVRGELEVRDKGEIVTRGARLNSILREAVDENLPKLAKASLLLD